MAQKPSPGTQKMTHIRCAIFDLDGTLIDSVPAYFELMETILDTIGLPPAPKGMVSQFMTGGGLKVIESLIPAELQHRKEALMEEFMRVGRKTAGSVFKDRIKVFEGVPRLFESLSRMGIPMGIVTSTERSYIDRKLMPLEKRDVKKYLNVVIAIEDAPRKKPAPDPLIEASRRLGVSVEDCVYVGDSHVDIRAARAAGMTAVGVLSGLDDHETLKAEDPHVIIDSIDDLIRLF